MVYFEIKERDGPARKGEIKVSNKEIKTPCLIDEESNLTDFGSLWLKNKKNESEINILPNKIAPNSAPKEVARYLSNQNSFEISVGNERIYSPVIGGGRWNELRKSFAEKAKKSDIVTLETLKTQNFKNQIIETIKIIRETLPENTAIFAPGIATPSKLAILVYFGVDLFETTNAEIAAAKNKYFTDSGVFDLDKLDCLPCNCSICSRKTIEEISEKKQKKKKKLLKNHNINSLKLELDKINLYLKKGNFREYLERKIKNEPNTTAALRNFDKNHYEYQEKRTPTFKRGHLFANTIESYDRAEIKRFRNRIITRYTPPETELAVLLPCSAKKPYSLSKTHQIIKSVLGNKGNQLIITSPLGLVPRELELVYPAQHYDLPVMGNWLKQEKSIIKDITKAFFLKNSYDKVVVHLNDELRKLMKETFDEIGIKAVFTSKNKDPRSKKALSELKKETMNFEEINIKKETIRSMCDYQFGKDTGKDFIKNTVTKGRFPRLKTFKKQDQIASTTPNYGSISLTLEGGHILNLKNNYRVEIDNFYPKGSVLAPGVKKSDEEIRPNDEVIFEGKKAFGVGRSKMSGFEMLESDRGVAIQTRHVEEK